MPFNLLGKKTQAQAPAAAPKQPAIDPLADLNDAIELANVKVEKMKKNADLLGKSLGALN
ncbi:Uncharacterised protein [uncultured archaeon]|nr:Uncharacterised protein [uncultured archaeon]